MKYKTWFRLVIRAIGVLLIGMSIPTLCNGIGQILLYLDAGMVGAVGASRWPYYLMWFLGGLLQFGAGLYLFFGGTWVINKCIPSNRPYCPECGYDLSRSRGEKCQECGVVLPAQPPRDQAR